MKLSFKTLLATAVLGAAALPMLSSAQDEKPAPPPAEGGGNGNGGGGQRPGGSGGRRGMPTPEQMVAHLDEAVTLTADQKTKVLEIYKKNAADMQAVPREQRREKMPELMKSQHDSIRALLTADQQKKFDAMPAPGGRGGPGGPGGPGGGRPPRGGGEGSSSTGGGDEAPKKTE